METSTLWAEVIEACSPKRLATALGRPEKTIYRWCATGERNLLDWMESLIQVLALRPNGRPILIRLHHWSNELFRRALDGSGKHFASVTELQERAVRLLRETADVVEKCTQENVNCAEVVREALEARDVLDRIIAVADAGGNQTGSRS